MTLSIKVIRRVNNGNKEIIETCKLIRENAKTIWVKLLNGDIIKRHKRDIVQA